MQVTVGRIGRPHGIRGDVVVGVRTDEPELRFAKGSRLDTDPAGLGPLTVAGIKWHSGELLVRFEGISDRDAAAELRGTWLTVDSATIAPPEDPDEFRDADLVGLSVRTVGGTAVGTVDDVLHSGQDVLVIKWADGREIMLPFVKPFVPEVSVASGFLVIDPPDGLLDLENSLLSVGCGCAGREGIGRAQSGADQTPIGRPAVPPGGYPRTPMHVLTPARPASSQSQGQPVPGCSFGAPRISGRQAGAFPAAPLGVTLLWLAGWVGLLPAAFLGVARLWLARLARSRPFLWASHFSGWVGRPAPGCFLGRRASLVG